MKKFLILTTILTLSFSANQAFAITATASANVVSLISVVETAALNFGSFAASGSAGTINQDGTVVGGVTAVSAGASRTAAVFDVSGDSFGAGYNFILPATTTLNSGGNSMTADLSFASGATGRTLDNSGNDIVTINGVLNVGANQVAGAYDGTYEITVVYN